MTLRSTRRPILTMIAATAGPVFIAAPIVLAAIIAARVQDLSLVILACTSLPFCSVLLAWRLMQTYRWVELDGSVLRGQRFWTRQLVERGLDEIHEIVPLATSSWSGSIALDGTSLNGVKGYEIRFHSGPPITLLRQRMDGVDEMVAALLERQSANAVLKPA